MFKGGHRRRARKSCSAVGRRPILGVKCLNMGMKPTLWPSDVARWRPPRRIFKPRIGIKREQERGWRSGWYHLIWSGLLDHSMIAASRAKRCEARVALYFVGSCVYRLPSDMRYSYGYGHRMKGTVLWNCGVLFESLMAGWNENSGSGLDGYILGRSA